MEAGARTSAEDSARPGLAAGVPQALAGGTPGAAPEPTDRADRGPAPARAPAPVAQFGPGTDAPSYPAQAVADGPPPASWPAAQGAGPGLPGAAGAAGRKVVLIIGGQLLGAAMGFGTILLTGRYIDPGSLGSFTFASAVIGLLVAASSLGIGHAHQRHVSQGIDLAACMGVQVRIRLAVWGVLFLLSAAAALLWSRLGPGGTQATTPAVLAVVAMTGILSALRTIPLETWAGQQRIHRGEIVRFVDSFVALAAYAVVALSVGAVVGGEPPPPGFFKDVAAALGIEAGISIEEIAFAVAMAYLAGKAVSMVPLVAWWIGDRTPMGRWDPALARRYLRFALPVALTGAIALVMQFTDVLVLGTLWDDAEGQHSDEVGHYAMAYRLAGVAGITTIAVAAVLFPRFTALFAMGERARAMEVFEAAERYTLMVMAPACGLLVAMPEEVLHIVGDRYAASAGPMRLLALAVILGGLSAPLSTKFLGDNALRVSVVAALVGSVLNLALNLLLVPKELLRMGATGAALASLLAWLASYAYLRWKARQTYGMPALSGALVRILAAGMLACALWWLAAEAFTLSRIWHVAATGLAGLLVYALVLRAAGELRPSDIRFAKSLLHPGRMLDELRGK